MMTSRERVLTALSHEESDRIPIHDTPWVATARRWREEGLPRNTSVAEHFGYEIVRFMADTTPRIPIKVVEENEEYIVSTTPFGGLRRDHKDYSTTPGMIDYPCKNREDWEKLKERLVPCGDRVDWEGKWINETAQDERGEESILDTDRVERRRGLQGCRKAGKDEVFVTYSATVGYDKIQSYVATERLLIAIATEPEWVKDMCQTDADLALAMFTIMKEGGFKFDGVWLSCDLGYRNGLLFSPQHFNGQLRPTLRRLFDFFHEQGLPVILHSCGSVKTLIPSFIQDGLDCPQPLEVKAGMELVALKRQFGDRIAFMGGIDVRAMANPDPTVSEDEVRIKIPAARKGGGYIYHSDHSVPSNVSLAQYQRMIDLVKKHGTY
jgi:uroporphyrinogen decarboxylase